MAFTSARATALTSGGIDPNEEDANDRESAFDAHRPAAIRTSRAYRAVKLYMAQTQMDVIIEKQSQHAMTTPR